VIDPALGRSLWGQERDHVRGVEVALETLGRRAQRARVVPPRRAALADRPAFARFALELETEAVAGYVEVLARLDAPGLLQPLGSIMTSGAQHQVALRRVLAEPLLARGG
jgi:Ferritin-like domain